MNSGKFMLLGNCGVMDAFPLVLLTIWNLHHEYTIVSIRIFWNKTSRKRVLGTLFTHVPHTEKHMKTITYRHMQRYLQNCTDTPQQMLMYRHMTTHKHHIHTDKCTVTNNLRQPPPQSSLGPTEKLQVGSAPRLCSATC